MALNLPGIPVGLHYTPEDTGTPDWAGSLLKGLQVANKGVEAMYKPRTMSEQLLAQQLANRINKLKAENAQEWYKAQLNHMLAQTGLLGAQTNEADFYTKHPLLKLGGIGGLIGAQQYLDENGSPNQNSQSLYGDSEATMHPGSSGAGGPAPDTDKVLDEWEQENPNATKMTLTQANGTKPQSYSQILKDAINAEMNKTKTLNTYRQSLIDTAQKRASGGLTKDLIDAADVDEGFMPGTNRQVHISPEMQGQYKNEYALKIQKAITDTQARSKNLLATNIEKTLNNIDPIALTQYAGLAGEAEKKLQQGKAISSKESKAYDAYVNSVKAAKFLAHQVRQFYGASIQPSVVKELESLSNPATWKNNPKLALQEFKTFSKILGQELDTYRGALKSTKAYQGEGANKPIKMIWDANGNLVRAQ